MHWNHSILTLRFVAGVNLGSWVYVLQAFDVKNQGFTFDIIDVFNLSFGLDGALDFVEIDADGSLAKYSTGAK